jgi:hypothetical protein
MCPMWLNAVSAPRQDGKFVLGTYVMGTENQLQLPLLVKPVVIYQEVWGGVPMDQWFVCVEAHGSAAGPCPVRG